ncbi:MAG TPA: CRISPR-associated protein Cas4 [Anaerolineales bacterium]|nr:CRISPR-associated protein Cas4 [Anaerolineales bacterium]
MVYIAFALLFLALILFWQSTRQRQSAGLPGGRVIYSDTRGWGDKLERPLFDQALGLTGKPDYLIQQNGQIIPVEVKSGMAPEAPYDSHIYQLASYCLLVEKTYGKRPPYGVIHYKDRDFAIDYTQALESSLLDLLAEMKRDEHKKEVGRSHEQAARCTRCGFRKICDQKLG